MKTQWVLGVDVGGSFTDFIAVASQSKEVRIVKVPTVRNNQALGVREGLFDLETDIRSQLWQVIHGTTVATNAVLERDGAETGLITTKGFRDILELRRRDRPLDQGGYGLQGSFEPLVPRWRRFEIPERVDAEGQIVKPINLANLEDLVVRLLDDGVESLAVCLLHSYANPGHEQQLGEKLTNLWPNSYVSLSSDILPDIREFERTSTTVLNAFVQPIVSRYLARMDQVLDEAGYEGSLKVVKSNGGLLPSDVAEQLPVSTILSGPAAGVVAGAEIGAEAGAENVLTFDMGGTSLDICVVTGGRLAIKTDTYLDFGIQSGIPMADIHTMGAGGGSIAFLGPDGVLEVGPISAGSDPGPACYGRGGTRPTLTDAHVVMGNLGGSGSPGLAGRIHPSISFAAKAIEAEIANELGLGVEEAAEAIIAVANTNMASALRRLSIERGFDPRELALVAFGGAGPMHAYSMLEELRFQQVVIPRYPGNTSALGCLLGQIRYDWIEPLRHRLEGFEENIRVLTEQHAARGKRLLREAGFTEDQIKIDLVLDVSYLGQSHTIPVHFENSIGDVSLIREQFDTEYRRRFDRLLPETALMVVNIRSSAVGQGEAIDLRWLANTGASEPKLQRLQSARLDGEWHDIPVYRRDDLPVEWVVRGPALIEQFDSTTLIGGGASAQVDHTGSLIMTLD